MVNIVVLLAAFVAMEGVAWFAHKYVMHGFLWCLHRDHHTRENRHFFERNDAFFLLFATPGILLVYAGFGSQDWGWLLWLGTGIALYGLAYIFVHDLFIHRRFRLPNNLKNSYLVALRRAHRLHHKSLVKEGGQCFGMLWPAARFWSSQR